MTKRALITGITGQDGSYLAELLLSKGYEVHGLIRRASTFNTARVDHLYVDPHDPKAKLFLHYGDLSDGARLVTLLAEIRPDEVYNPLRNHTFGSHSTNLSTRPTPLGWGQFAFSRRSACQGLKQSSTRLRLLKCLERHHPHRTKTPCFTRAPLWCRQGLQLLDNQELPRGLRDVRC